MSGLPADRMRQVVRRCGSLVARGPDRFAATEMPHAAELEQMASIMASCAAILRKLVASMDEDTHVEIDDVADMIERASAQLADLVKAPSRQ